MKRWAIGVAAALIAAAWVGSAVIYPALPDRVPTHWNIRGEVDAYGPKTVPTLLMPAIMTGLLALFCALPWLSPAKFQVDTFPRTYSLIVVLTIGLQTYLHAAILAATMHPKMDVGRWLLGGLFLFFALMGNLMGKVRRNFWMGVRVPWTLASERVWNDTHRVTAWLYVGAGLIGCVLCLLGWVLIATGLLLVAAFAPIGYSLWRYKSLERAGLLDLDDAPAAEGAGRA
jgi:uncharacterized membrane protein